MPGPHLSPRSCRSTVVCRIQNEIEEVTPVLLKILDWFRRPAPEPSDDEVVTKLRENLEVARYRNIEAHDLLRDSLLLLMQARISDAAPEAQGDREAKVNNDLG